MTAFATIVGFILVVIGAMIFSIPSTVSHARRNLFGPWEKAGKSQKRLESHSYVLGVILLVIGFTLVGYGLAPA